MVASMEAILRLGMAEPVSGVVQRNRVEQRRMELHRMGRAGRGVFGEKLRLVKHCIGWRSNWWRRRFYEEAAGQSSANYIK